MPTEEAVFLCLSIEDKRGTFQYTWYLGDHRIQQSTGDNDELVEDLLPAGSRLTIRNAQKSRSYKCVVESESGHAEDNVTLMVVKGKLAVPTMSLLVSSSVIDAFFSFSTKAVFLHSSSRQTPAAQKVMNIYQLSMSYKYSLNLQLNSWYTETGKLYNIVNIVYGVILTIIVQLKICELIAFET